MADQIDSFLASGGNTPILAPSPAPQSSGSDPVDSWLASGGKTDLTPAQPVSPDESVKRLVAHEATQMGASVVGGFRSIYDLVTGKSIAETDQRYKDFVREHSYQPQDTVSKGLVGAYDKVSGSAANPLNWPGRAADIVAENTVGPGSNIEEAAARQVAKERGLPYMGVTNPAAAPIFSGALQFGVGAAQAAAGLRRAPVTIEQEAEPHPLAAAAQAETERLGQIRTQGMNAGLDLPEGGTPAQHAQASVTNQPIANAMTREELKLPGNAPLTPKLLTDARETYASPAYEAVKSEPQIQLGPKYDEAIEKLHEIPAEFSGKLKPPDTVISGAEAVDLSKKFRFRANQYDRQAQLTGSPEASDLAELHRGAAEAIEDAVRDHFEAAGKPNVAQEWDNARVYTAKTYSVQNALDGAGNVRVAQLKQQLLKNKPLSGNLETLATLGAQYPEAFKLSRATAPQVGLVRRATAAVLPHISTAAGAGAGAVLGPVGATAGAVSGRVIGENLANRINPQ